MLELLNFSTQPPATVCCANTDHLLYMPENIQKDIEIHRRAVKNNGLAVKWDVIDVFAREKK